MPMDIDPEDKAPAALPAASEGGSWTYSSYLASWVPTWAYNAQEQEAAAATDASGADETDAPGQTAADAPPRTPAEQVKADALARDAAAAVFDANKAVLNNATRSGWINFFASRSANLPREARDAITNDDGMEVMDISGIEGGYRPAVAKAVTQSNGRLAPDASTRPKTTKAGSLGGSRASSLAGDSEGHHTSARSLTSKESIKNLGRTAITKAANVAAASTAGLGKGKRTDGAQSSGNGSSSNGGNAGSNGQPAKDISKKLAPNGSGPSRPGTPTPTKSVGDPIPVVPPNLVLPSFEDTFTRAPRMWSPKVGVLERTLSAVNSYLFSKVPDLDRMKRPTRFSTYGEQNLGSSASSFKGNAASFAGKGSTQRLAGKAKATGAGSSKDKGVETALKEVAESAQRLPRAWSTVGLHERAQCKGTAGIGKIVVIGVHGWFSQSIFKTVIGEPTGTSAKFAAMQTESIRRHFLEAGLELNPEAITAISLQGDGKVADRVDRLFSELISRPNWVNDLKNADAVFLSAHSQGAIVATQLLARLIEQRHILAESTRICLLAMCGVHHGPFAHLKSSITASYINYFENAAAKELFEFQSSSTAAAKQYTAALKIILDAGVKCVYVGSTDDNVVPIYSALNSSNNHPSILRALYIDGRAFPKVDFLTNLLVLCVAVRNAGLSDHNLLTLLSASVAGSLYGGLGHSLVYGERAVYDLATRYLFEVTHPLAEPTFAPGPPGTTIEPRRATDTDPANAPTLMSDAFEAQRWNPYDLPWSLRGLFEDKHVRSLFAADMLSLLQSYEEWRPDPKSKSLKDLQWRLAPMRSIRPPEVEGDGGEAEGQLEEEERGEKVDKGGKGKGKDGKGSKL
uniref:YMC020W-like alpha/beta hydrolase domain-containing protein n=2 Tax=Kalmanozyma brasiliensis (strain GHG001) TaxID=1365824 RepID=V5EST2_KALBG